jgi:putative ABC transport system substrate-binding protein
VLLVSRRAFIVIFCCAAVWGQVLHAQRPAAPVVGFLNMESYEGLQYLVAAFRQGLAQTGYVEGQNMAIEYRWAEGQANRLPTLVEDLVRRQVAVIAVGGGGPARRAVKEATATIPIVFISGGDPVAEGLVASLNRPGRNVTGVSFLTAALEAKRLGLLHEAVPTADRVAVLMNPTSTSAATRQDIEAAARALGLQVQLLNASNERDIDRAFASLSQLRAQTLLVTGDALFNEQRKQLVDLASRHVVPAIYELREFVEAGGLMSYGTSVSEGYRQMGVYVGKILQGAKPADLPVLQSTKFELVINLKTARALGLAIPQPLLLRADEVIQ